LLVDADREPAAGRRSRDVAFGRTGDSIEGKTAPNIRAVEVSIRTINSLVRQTKTRAALA